MIRCITPRLTISAGHVVIGILLVVMFQAGCKRSATIVGPKGERVTETKNGEDTELAFKGMNGENIRSSVGKKGVALPLDFPSDVAIYPKATPIMVATKDKETAVLLTTTDSLQKTLTFYKGQLKERGWKIKLSSDAPKVSLLQAEKEGRTLAVLLTETAEGAGIQLTLVKKE
jgi:hypothetical protein